MKVITIGRDGSQDICLDNEMISRRHAILRVYNNGKMEIVSLGQNGTCVNGNPCKPNTNYPLKRNDVVSFAHVYELDWALIPNPLKWLKITAWAVVIISLISVAVVLTYKYLPIGKDKKVEKIENTEENFEYNNSDSEPDLGSNHKFELLPETEENADKLLKEEQNESVDTLRLFFKPKKNNPDKKNKIENKKDEELKKDSTTAIGNILS